MNSLAAVLAAIFSAGAVILCTLGFIVLGNQISAIDERIDVACAAASTVEK